MGLHRLNCLTVQVKGGHAATPSSLSPSLFPSLPLFLFLFLSFSTIAFKNILSDVLSPYRDSLCRDCVYLQSPKPQALSYQKSLPLESQDRASDLRVSQSCFCSLVAVDFRECPSRAWTKMNSLSSRPVPECVSFGEPCGKLCKHKAIGDFWMSRLGV